MVSSSTMRDWWSNYRCLNERPTLRRPIQMMGRNVGYCAVPAYDAMKAAEFALVNTGYQGTRSLWIPRNCPTGIGGKTCQSDGDNCSLHNYGIAFDIDPFGYGNPHFFKKYGDGWNFYDCKLTREQVEAVEGIKNEDGDTMFRWLGWVIGDTMHFELQVPPKDGKTRVDWRTIPGIIPEGVTVPPDPDPEPPPEGGEEAMLPLQEGQEGEDITLLQDRMNLAYNAGVPLTAKYDGATVEAVKTFLGSYTGNSGWQAGKGVGGKQWSRLTLDLVKAHAKGEKGDKGDPGEPGPPGELIVRGSVELP